MSISFSQARENYANRGHFKSTHTQEAYLRAIDLFFEYLNDQRFTPKLPIQTLQFSSSGEILLGYLSAQDELLLLNFAQWLRSPGSNATGDKRPYALSTIELRLAGILRWFEFIREQRWLPAEFSLENAANLFKTGFQTTLQNSPDKTAEVKHDLSALLTYYDTQRPPKRLSNNPEKLERWELTRLRNCALIKTLAETGGQVSGILSINVNAIEKAEGELVIQVTGKNNHHYQIHLREALPAIQEYVNRRAIPHEKVMQTPLFVSHDRHYEGSRMSRIIAWRIIQRAAKGLHLPAVSPHDLRHWCAQQWIAAGASPEEVKARLGHRSMHTIRTYYGHMFKTTEEA